MLQMAQEKRKEEDPDERCRIVGDDTIAGDAAQVYTLGNETGAGSKLWISKATGALLRQTITLPDGSISDSRYEYKNVQAPEGGALSSIACQALRVKQSGARWR